MKTHSTIAKHFFCFSLLVALPCGAANANASIPSYRLRLYHLHTGEHIDVVYRIGDQYLPDGVAELDHFLRDHRTGDVKDYDGFSVSEKRGGKPQRVELGTLEDIRI